MTHGDIAVEIHRTGAWDPGPKFSIAECRQHRERATTKDEMMIPGPAMYLATAPIRMYTPAFNILLTPKITRFRMFR